MGFRRLLIAAVLLAALGGGVWWSNRQKASEEGKPAKDAPPKIVQIPEDQMRKIEIDKKGVDPTIVERPDGGKWQITSAKPPLPAADDSMSSLASSLANVSADQVVEETAPSDLSPYGLNAPSIVITVTKKDNKTVKLLVGDDTPAGGNVYAKVDGDKRIVTLASYVKTSLDKSPKDLRDKRLLTVDGDKVSRVELHAKNQDVEFGRINQNEWQILKPKPLRADGFTVEDLVRKLKDAKMDTSVSDDDAKKAVASFGGATPVAIAKVTDASGTQSLEVRKDKDKNYWAKSSVVEGVHKVTAEVGDGLDKGLEDFRNKKLFDFGFSEPSKLEIKDGTKVSSYQKSGEKWSAGGKTMDSTSVNAFIDKARDLSATKFADTGFTTPELELTVTSNDGKRVEKVQISKGGTSYFAKRENEPSVYELDAKTVDELRKAAGDIKEDTSKPGEKKK